MQKQVYKRQVIAKLETLGYDRLHTLSKTWEQKNGIPRRGWFIATLNGWKYLGDDLAHALDRLEMEEEAYGYVK